MSKEFKVIDLREIKEVICDMCDKDFSKLEISGGFLFGSKAVCPDCADSFLKVIMKNNELSFMKGFCPAGMSFKDFILLNR